MNEERNELNSPSGSDPACIYCAIRDSCMAYDDDTLVRGAKDGHVPTIDDNCTMFKQGNAYTRQHALDEIVKFNEYAKDLMKAHSNQNRENSHREPSEYVD